MCLCFHSSGHFSGKGTLCERFWSCPVRIAVIDVFSILSSINRGANFHSEYLHGILGLKFWMLGSVNLDEHTVCDFSAFNVHISYDIEAINGYTGSGFLSNKDKIEEGDTVIIYVNFGTVYAVDVERGRTLNMRYGALRHDYLIGKRLVFD